MFEALSRYRVVIVTGPHRSGTTICARIVERDAGLRYEDLKAHPLWLPAEKRRHFGPRQWALREAVAE